VCEKGNLAYVEGITMGRGDALTQIVFYTYTYKQCVNYGIPVSSLSNDLLELSL
jgi:hypothetical protein